MIGLDTNILARYYIQDEADKEAEKQHQLARTLLESGQALMVCKTVMRGYYHFSASEIVAVFKHLLSLESFSLEDRDSIQQAVANFESGFDFADALHHASYINCDKVVSFDDKKFARRATRLDLNPGVIVPK